MYRIARQFSFEAAHRLPLPSDHKCSRVHGHSYTVEIAVCGDVLDATGFLVDFAALDPLGRYVAEALDHRCLNDVVAVPSSEHLARHLYRWSVANVPLPDRVSVQTVRVSETRRSWAEYGESA